MRKSTHQHPSEAVTRAASLFFAVRGIVRTRLAHGKKLDPSAWLYVETMKFIGDRDRPSMRMLAEHLSITAPSATSLVTRLTRAGLVTRTKNPRDRRASELVLTRKGQARLKRTVERGIGILGEVFSVLTPEEFAAFTAALERIRTGDGG